MKYEDIVAKIKEGYTVQRIQQEGRKEADGGFLYDPDGKLYDYPQSKLGSYITPAQMAMLNLENKQPI